MIVGRGVNGKGGRKGELDIAFVSYVGRGVNGKGGRKGELDIAFVSYVVGGGGVFASW